MAIKPKSQYDAVVVGAGIGGLLSAAFLARQGYSTCVLERLSFFGGKFTAFDYQGFQIPSGAFHMFPGGEHGGLGRCCADLKLNLEFVYPETPAVILENGKRYLLHGASPHKIFYPDSFLWRFSWREILSFLFIFYYLRNSRVELPDIAFGDLLKLFSGSPKVKKIFDQFMIFANGVDSDSASLIEFKEGMKAAGYRPEGLIKGGCRRLMDELTGCIKNHGGELYNKTPVAAITLSGGKVTGVELGDGSRVKAGLVVTNVGPRRTRELLGTHTPKWFAEKESRFKPAYGISYSVATSEPLLAHDGIEIPLDHEYICGYIQISNLDRTLAPLGKHFLLAAQMPTDLTQNIKDAIRGGVADLLNIFPQISQENIINISSFHKGWAGCPTGQRQGQSGPNRYPIRVEPFENLFMVSHDSQGWGFAGDIIGHAALSFKQMI